MWGTFSPSPQVSDPGMHHGTCVAADKMPMGILSDSGYVTAENVLGMPGAWATSNSRIWKEAHPMLLHTVYPKKYAHGFCFAVLCCGYTLTDFPISIRLTSLALWQSNDCPSASNATLMNMDKYMWIHYERLHSHNKAKHNKTVCIFIGIYCSSFYIAIKSLAFPCLLLKYADVILNRSFLWSYPG